ncbi:MAG: hypothetical protein WCJ11_12425 [Methylococcaceae bacterium]
MTETPEKPKLSHGGARFNAGAKKSKPATVAIRVDARLVELIDQLKMGIQSGAIEDYKVNLLAREFQKRNLDYLMDYDGTALSGKTSEDYAAEYKKRMNGAIDKHGAKLKGGMTLFNLLQKCIKDAAPLIKNGVFKEREIITKFLAAHDLESVEEIRTFDEWRGSRRV